MKFEKNRMAIMLAVMLVASTSFATTPPNGKPPKSMLQQQQDQYQRQLQAQQQKQVTNTANTATASASLGSMQNSATTGPATAIAGGGASVNEGVNTNITQNYDSGVPDTVLVPNNNTASCISVLGISAANDSGSGMLGIPLPEKLLWWETPTATCNYEGAADDAFAAGEREMGWFWKCHIKSLWRPFRTVTEGVRLSKAESVKACHTYAVGEVTDQQLISSLRNQLEFERNERSIERTKCKESNDRMSAAWKESCSK